MTKNLKRYHQAWEIRQQGKKLREIAEIMGFKSRENARKMISYIDFLIKKRPRRISKDLKLKIISAQMTTWSKYKNIK